MPNGFLIEQEKKEDLSLCDFTASVVLIPPCYERYSDWRREEGWGVGGLGAGVGGWVGGVGEQDSTIQKRSWEKDTRNFPENLVHKRLCNGVE